MGIELSYGDGILYIDLPEEGTDIFEPVYARPLRDEKAAFQGAVRKPLDAPSLREAVGNAEKLAVVIPDNTRPFPGDRIIPWLLEELQGMPYEKITVIIGTGSHRACTAEEKRMMLGDAAGLCRVVTHNAFDPQALLRAGFLCDGRPVSMNREYIQADRRILLGFVEPHFMAGFSGGYKAVCPGILGIDDIIHFHGAAMIDHPLSTWGTLDGNPTQAMVRECGSLQPADFCINVTLDRQRHLTGVFAGEPLACHDAACLFCRRTAMLPAKGLYDIVITTNGGYPLDQNLYQTVKGMSAACRIVKPGGLIICASECRDGFPEHGNFKRLLAENDSPDKLLKTIRSSEKGILDQWEAQLLAVIISRARVALYSSLPENETAQAGLEPVKDIGARLGQELKRLGGRAIIAVLPEGPMSVPYVPEEGKNEIAG